MTVYQHNYAQNIPKDLKIFRKMCHRFGAGATPLAHVWVRHCRLHCSAQRPAQMHLSDSIANCYASRLHTAVLLLSCTAAARLQR